jgi:hypothetical protein
VQNYFAGQAFQDVPVIDEATITARGAISPKDDYPSVTHVAMLFNLTATPGTGVSRSLAAPAAQAAAAMDAPAPAVTPFAAVKSKQNPLFDDAE